METFVECGEFWYWATLGPSPPFSPFFVTLRHKQLQCSHCLHQTKTDTREDTAPPTQSEASDRHLSPQQTMHTDNNQSRSHFFLKPRAKLLVTLCDTNAAHWCRTDWSTSHPRIKTFPLTLESTQDNWWRQDTADNTISTLRVQSDHPLCPSLTWSSAFLSRSFSSFSLWFSYYLHPCLASFSFFFFKYI